MDNNKEQDLFDTNINWDIDWGDECITSMSYSYINPLTFITSVNIDSSGYVINDDNISIVLDSEFNAPDPYEKLEEYDLEKEKDENLRDRYPALREAYEEYQLIKKLVEDNDLDNNFEKRYEDFKIK